MPKQHEAGRGLLVYFGAPSDITAAVVDVKSKLNIAAAQRVCKITSSLR